MLSEPKTMPLLNAVSVRRPGDIYDVMTRARAGLEELSLRDQHKINKLERISAAAQKLFAHDGYEGTTLRDIAHEAGVALGTLSHYARDKRDLILLIFNKVIPPLLEQGLRNARRSGTLAENMVAFFEPFYRAYAKNETLYRIVLGHIYGDPASTHVSENNVIRADLVSNLSSIVQRAVTAGECRSGLDLHMQAHAFYFLYFAAVRAWLADVDPQPDKGLAFLKALFEQHVDGLRRND
jgi:AcrR family transcriptional regulator